MAFNDLQLKAASESAVMAAHKNLAKLSLFAKSFSELNDRPGASIAVPVYNLSAAGEFSASNNYCGGGNEIDGALITLDKHLVKSVSMSDIQQAETGIRWASDTAAALADTLARGVNNYVFGMLSSDEITLTADVTLTSKTAIANLYATAADNDIPVDRAVVVLTPANFAAVLSQLDSNVFGGDEAIRYGYVPNLYGFAGFMSAPNLPAGVDGFIIAQDAIGIASRYVYPGTENAYPEVWTATTDDGFTIGYRRFMDLCNGVNRFAADVLFGAKILQADKIVKLT